MDDATLIHRAMASAGLTELEGRALLLFGDGLGYAAIGRRLKVRDGRGKPRPVGTRTAGNAVRGAAYKLWRRDLRNARVILSLLSDTPNSGSPPAPCYDERCQLVSLRARRVTAEDLAEPAERLLYQTPMTTRAIGTWREPAPAAS